MAEHKKFILFKHMMYYPRGGLRDISGSFETLEEAVAEAKRDSWDSTYVVDRDTWAVVFGELL